MALDFPSNPQTGDTYLAPNNQLYLYDGEKWIGFITPSGTVAQGITFVGDDSTGTRVSDGESFKIAGTQNITTAVSGDTLTITGPNLSSYLTNSTLTVVGDDSTGVTLNSGETIKIAGGSGIDTAVSGDTLTVTAGGITNSNLSGSAGITNANLQYSNITLGSTSTSLGGTSTTLDGLTQLTVDNIDLNGKTISTTDTNGDLTLSPNGQGVVKVPAGYISRSNVDSNTLITKGYADSIQQALNIHAAVKAATTDTLATLTGGTVTYNNGTDGVTATLTLQNALTILDSYTLLNGDRILVKDQANQAHNGIYTWATGGTVLTRATDFDTNVEIAPGDFVFVINGTANGNKGYAQTQTITTVGSDNIIFTQFSGAGELTAGAGLTKTDSALDVNVDSSTIEIHSDILRVKDAGITNVKLANSSIGIADDTSSTTAISLGETLKIAGTQNVSTAVSGDTLTITGPDLSSYLTAVPKTIDVNAISSSDSSAIQINDAVNLSGLLTANAGLTINNNSNTWSFGSTGTLTVPANGIITAPNAQEFQLQAKDTNSVLRNEINLDPNSGTYMSVWSPASSNSFSTGDWATASWVNESGLGVAYFTNAENLQDFWTTGVGSFENIVIEVSINSGSRVPVTYDGNNGEQYGVTLILGNAVPVSSPTTITSLTFYYQTKNRINIDYDGGEILIDAQSMNIKLQTTELLDLRSGGNLNIRGLGQQPVRIYTDNPTHMWEFDTTGSLTLPREGKINGIGDGGPGGDRYGYMTWDGNSSAGGLGWNTMKLVSDTGLESVDTYIILDPSYVDSETGSIHIRAGGTLDNSLAHLCLGGENSHVKIGAGANPPVTVKANNNSWTFGTDGTLTFPDSTTQNTAARITVVGDDSTGVTLNAGETIKIAGSGSITTSVSGDTITITGTGGGASIGDLTVDGTTISSGSSSKITLNESVDITGTLQVNDINSADSSAIQINDGVNVGGDLNVSGSINKVTITAPAAGSTLTIANGKTLTASNSLTFTGTDATSFAFPGTSGTVVTLAATQSLTNKTLTLPVIDNIKHGYSTTATAAGTTILTSTSNYMQFFTGSMTQILSLPAPQTMTLGQGFLIVNNSTGSVEVRAANSATVITVLPGTAALCISIDLTAGNGAAGWNAEFVGFSSVTGTGANVLAVSPTITGTLTANTFVTNDISSADSSAIQINDSLNASGTITATTFVTHGTGGSITGVNTLQVNEISSADSTAIQINDAVNVSGTLTAPTLATNEISSSDSSAIQINDGMNIRGTISVSGSYQVNGKQAVNGPAFRAYVDSAQTITSGSQQKVIFGSETFDTNGNFASSTFTPNVEGYYQLNATVRIAGASGTGECMIIIWKNGSEYARGNNTSGAEQGTNFYSMQVSDIAYANGSTDYFEIYIQQGSGGNRDTTLGANISYFSGSMIRGA